VILRLACALLIVSQLILVAMLLEPEGTTAIAFTFFGNPALAVAVLLVLLSWWTNREGS
jgi:hypothetical protein